MQTIQAQPYRADVINLLTAANLPTQDLPLLLDNFFVTTENDKLTGVIGLEIYGQYGLLRSLAVDATVRNIGVAGNLLHSIESLAVDKNLKAIYLLTETAQDYFDRKGYEHVARMDVPEEIKGSSEFSHVCPDSAIAMVKYIND